MRQGDNAPTGTLWRDRKAEHPNDFVPWKGLESWRCPGSDLDDHLDAIMHLLFLGIVKSFLQQVVEWVKMQRMNTSFSVAVEGILEKVKSLGVSSFKVTKWGKGTFGPWVSENFLGCSRLMKWHLSLLAHLKPTDPEFVPLLTNPKEWKVDQLRDWLRAFGEPVSRNKP